MNYSVLYKFVAERTESALSQVHIVMSCDMYLAMIDSEVNLAISNKGIINVYDDLYFLRSVILVTLLSH